MRNAVLALVPFLLETRNDPQPQHTSILTGAIRLNELMDPNINENTFLEEARMTPEMFDMLILTLKNRGGLTDGPMISAGEKYLILTRVLRGYTNRECKLHWQHSGATIHACIYEAISSIINIGEDVFIQPKLDDPVHPSILNDNKFYPYFEHCIGAVTLQLIIAN